MWYQKSAREVIKTFGTNPETGLSTARVIQRQKKYGPNVLPSKKKPPLIWKFIAQFQNILVSILLAATIISFIVGDTADAMAIFLIVVINAALGFLQEMQAEKTLESLREKDIQMTLVERDGRSEKIPSSKVVPGDILILEEGERIPSDARVIESFSLHVDESILTGESLPASKNTKEIDGVIPLADRKNMVFKDTRIMTGRGKAVVTAIGKDTEMGKIALFLETAKPQKTPLTKELEKAGQNITIAVLTIAAVLFAVNFYQNKPLADSLLISISLAVAAIPEGLPAIITIILSLGVARLAEKKTIVKKLPSVETLGAVRIIATDKTGTLTQNKINVTLLTLPDGRKFSVEGLGYRTEGIFFESKSKKVIDPFRSKDLILLLEAGALANNASINIGGNKEVSVIGDTTEAALLVAAKRAGIDTRDLKTGFRRVWENPFTSERKMMSVVVEIDDTRDYYLYAKGAPETILEKCILDGQKKEEILAMVRQSSAKGLRSLAIARKRLTSNEIKTALEEENISEDGMEYLGIASMEDPLRPEVAEAIYQAKLAGIRTIMVTGDHKETAISIARSCGILSGNGKVMTEKEVSKLSAKELADELKNGVSVFARISPMGKLKIVEAAKRLPHTLTAVTGDGVNDAPAMKAGDISLAMGRTGTDITREVADIVITDDNYATIIDAVAEGRVIFGNLVKFVRYLISCNISEVLVVALGVIFALPLPLIPLQILWINLITDGFPALALGVEPAARDIMNRPPRDLTVGILHRKRWIYMIAEGTVMGLAVLLLFIFALGNSSYREAQSMAFSALTLTQLVHAFNNRSTRKSLFQIGFFTNRYLLLAVGISLLLQIVIVQSSAGNLIFRTSPLDPPRWMMVALVALIPFLVVELKKQLRFRILP